MVRSLIRKAMLALGNGPARATEGSPAADVTPFARPLDAVYSQSRVVFSVPIERCRTPYFLSFLTDGSNPYVETARDYCEGKHTIYEGSCLYHYYERCRTDRRNDAFAAFIIALGESHPPFLMRVTEGSRPPFPWEPDTPSRERPPRGRPASAGSNADQEYPHEKARQNFSRLTNLCESIQNRGYLPTSAPDGEIRGFFLKRGDDYRFVVEAGMHRTAVLSALGYDKIRATFHGNHPRAIHLADLADWPQVRTGVYEPELAEKFFLRYFSPDPSMGEPRSDASGGHRGSSSQPQGPGRA